LLESGHGAGVVAQTLKKLIAFLRAAGICDLADKACGISLVWSFTCTREHYRCVKPDTRCLRVAKRNFTRSTRLAQIARGKHTWDMLGGGILYTAMRISARYNFGRWGTVYRLRACVGFSWGHCKNKWWRKAKTDYHGTKKLQLLMHVALIAERVPRESPFRSRTGE
jgi:hypothetical protein